MLPVKYECGTVAVIASDGCEEHGYCRVERHVEQTGGNAIVLRDASRQHGRLVSFYAEDFLALDHVRQDVDCKSCAALRFGLNAIAVESSGHARQPDLVVATEEHGVIAGSCISVASPEFKERMPGARRRHEPAVLVDAVPECFANAVNQHVAVGRAWCKLEIDLKRLNRRDSFVEPPGLFWLQGDLLQKKRGTRSR